MFIRNVGANLQDSFLIGVSLITFKLLSKTTEMHIIYEDGFLYMSFGLSERVV
jgi:hypothetical protein